MNERSQRWNRFVSDICLRNASMLSDLQRQAVICFWYDAELQNGGHCAYFDSEQCASPAETEAALRLIGTEEIADNFRKAVTKGSKDDWMQADNAYYAFSPSLFDRLTAFVEAHKETILNN